MSETETESEEFFNAFDDDANTRVTSEAETPEPPEPEETPETEEQPDAEDSDSKDEAQEAESKTESEASDAEPTSEDADDHQANYQAAMLAERTKRQALELTVKDMQLELERRNTAATQQAQPEQPIDYYADPEAAIRTEVDKGVNDVREELAQIKQSQINERFNMSETYARKAFGDDAFDKASGRYVEFIKDNPNAQAELMQQSDPASYAYNKGTELLAMDEHGGDINKMIESERAKAVAEYIESSRKKAPPSPPESLTKTASEAVKAEAPKGFNETGNFSEIWSGSG